MIRIKHENSWWIIREQKDEEESGSHVETLSKLCGGNPTLQFDISLKIQIVNSSCPLLRLLLMKINLLLTFQGRIR